MRLSDFPVSLYRPSYRHPDHAAKPDNQLKLRHWLLISPRALALSTGRDAEAMSAIALGLASCPTSDSISQELHWKRRYEDAIHTIHRDFHGPVGHRSE